MGWVTVLIKAISERKKRLDISGIHLPITQMCFDAPRNFSFERHWSKQINVFLKIVRIISIHSTGIFSEKLFNSLNCLDLSLITNSQKISGPFSGNDASLGQNWTVYLWRKPYLEIFVRRDHIKFFLSFTTFACFDYAPKCLNWREQL